MQVGGQLVLTVLEGSTLWRTNDINGRLKDSGLMTSDSGREISGYLHLTNMTAESAGDVAQENVYQLSPTVKEDGRRISE